MTGRETRIASALQVAADLSAFSRNAAAADDLKGGPVALAIDAAKEKWQARLASDPADWFDWLIDLPQSELLDLLARCASLTVSAWPGSPMLASANVMSKVLKLDTAHWWEAKAQSYLSHIPKAQLVEAFQEIDPAQPTDAALALKKDALLALAAAKLAGKTWLPPSLHKPG